MRKKDTEGNWINDELEWFKAIRVKTGDIIPIPSFAGHALVNTGKTWLVTSDDSPVNMSGDSASMPEHADYRVIQSMRGMGFYVVEKDGQPALVPNPSYKNLPTPEF
jgi:oxalate decarboxylase/phosphoglucose isomerase-like protein (cupin superfamily)